MTVSSTKSCAAGLLEGRTDMQVQESNNPENKVGRYQEKQHCDES